MIIFAPLLNTRMCSMYYRDLKDFQLLGRVEKEYTEREKYG